MGDLWGDVPTWLGLVGGVIGFRVAYGRYTRDQDWKRAEFLSNEMKEFFAKPRVRTATLLLDYNDLRIDPETGSFPVNRDSAESSESSEAPGGPERMSSSESASEEASEEASSDSAWAGRGGLRIDDATIALGLRSHLRFKGGLERFSPEQLLVRDSFDEFLSGLERFERFAETGLVDAADLHPYLDYWLRVMFDPSRQWKDSSFYKAIYEFVRTYDYTGVEALAMRFGYWRPPAVPAGELARAAGILPPTV